MSVEAPSTCFIRLDEVGTIKTVVRDVDHTNFFGLYTEPGNPFSEAPGGYHDIQLSRLNTFDSYTSKLIRELRSNIYPDARSRYLSNLLANLFSQPSFNSDGTKQEFRETALRHERTHLLQEVRFGGPTTVTRAQELFLLNGTIGDQSPISNHQALVLGYGAGALHSFIELQGFAAGYLNPEDKGRVKDKVLLVEAFRILELLEGTVYQNQQLDRLLNRARKNGSISSGFQGILLFMQNTQIEDALDQGMTNDEVRKAALDSAEQLILEPAGFLEKISSEKFLREVDLKIMKRVKKLSEIVDEVTEASGITCDDLAYFRQLQRQAA